MSESEHNERRSIVAMVGNPTSDKGRGTKVDAQVSVSYTHLTLPTIA